MYTHGIINRSDKIYYDNVFDISHQNICYQALKSLFTPIYKTIHLRAMRFMY